MGTIEGVSVTSGRNVVFVGVIVAVMVGVLVAGMVEGELVPIICIGAGWLSLVGLEGGDGEEQAMRMISTRA